MFGLNVSREILRGGLPIKMENHLELIAKSYDKAIEFGKRGIDLYNDLPEYITKDPNYQTWKQECVHGDSGCKDIKEYLLPHSDMKFVDLGCCLRMIISVYI